MRKLISTISALLIALVSTQASAINELAFQRLIGYTVVDVKTIVGYQDPDGTSGQDFKGCQFNRVIFFQDNRILTCNMYSYVYAYRPNAIIFSDGSNWKMFVENEVFDMRLR